MRPRAPFILLLRLSAKLSRNSDASINLSQTTSSARACTLVNNRAWGNPWNLSQVTWPLHPGCMPMLKTLKPQRFLINALKKERTVLHNHKLGYYYKSKYGWFERRIVCLQSYWVHLRRAYILSQGLCLHWFSQGPKWSLQDWFPNMGQLCRVMIFSHIGI